MDDIYVYRVKLPGKVKECVLPCRDGYTIYIDETLDDAQALSAYRHALSHIHRRDCDFDCSSVQKIEFETHKKYHRTNIGDNIFNRKNAAPVVPAQGRQKDTQNVKSM